MKKMQPAITTLTYEMPTNQVGVGRYVDIARDLSRVNRRSYRQGYQYAIGSITITDDIGGVTDLDVSISTAGNSWPLQNAWKKGQALWMLMNKEVLDSNPSVQGKWADYKVLMTENQSGANTLEPRDGAVGTYPAGEWNLATYVVPQHDVNAVTGQVLPAEEWYACLIGPDDVPNKRFSLVKAYEESRATVQLDAPNTPALLPDSFYLKLQDDGSQDPELAAVIADSNESPPYSMVAGDYPGGAGFSFSEAMTRVARGVKNQYTPTLHLPGFAAECGLLYVAATRSAGSDNCRIQINLVPGEYKGVLAVPMGQ